MGLFSIPAGRLRNRTVSRGGRLYKGVSIFPLFEQDGTVRRLILTMRESGGIYVLPLHALRPSLFGRMRLDVRVETFAPIRKTQMREIERLWHFDPDWILNEERYSAHWAKDALQNTNCVNRLPDKSALTYSRDLSRVRWIGYEDAVSGPVILGWDPTRLPIRPPRLNVRLWRKPSPGWVLDPVWARRS